MVKKKKIEVVAEPVEKIVETIIKESNPNVKIIELNGRKYNKIYHPEDGTTTQELIQ